VDSEKEVQGGRIQVTHYASASDFPSPELSSGISIRYNEALVNPIRRRQATRLALNPARLQAINPLPALLCQPEASIPAP